MEQPMLDMQQPIANEMQYLGPRFQGASSTFQLWSITPSSSNSYWTPNDVIKVMANLTQGVIDPYRSYLQIQVQVDEKSLPVGGIQLDSSAYSLIDQLVVLSGPTQIQRIQAYSFLGSMLVDQGFSQFVCQSRGGQGLGFTNNPAPAKPQHSHYQTSSSFFATTSNMAEAPVFQIANNSGYNPILRSTSVGTAYEEYPNGDLGATGPWNLTGITPSYASITNWLTFPSFVNQNYDFLNSYVSYLGRGPGLRSQYNFMADALGYPQSSTSPSLQGIRVKSSPVTYKQPTTGKSFITSNYNGTPYNVEYITNNYDIPFPGNNNQKPNFVVNGTQSAGVAGYNKPFIGQFMRGAFEPLLSPTIPQVGMKNGVILQYPVPLTRKTFRMPILSSTLGLLIPPDQFQLIPCASLQNLILQFTLNPYAFFSTGYSDINETDVQGMQTMIPRNFKITNFEWVWHLYTFNSEAIQRQLNQKLYRGIAISTNYWQLIVQYQLPNGSYLRNNFQLPINVQSLAQIQIILNSNDYLQKTFCRQNFRLSGNVTSLQFKANGNYFPLQPITGNAGCPQTVDTTGDNYNFYELLMLSGNYLFNVNSPIPRINNKNFAINQRCYNVNNQKPYLDPLLFNLPTKADLPDTNNINKILKSINTDTAMGQSWFHQNRYIGKCIYSYSWEPYGHSKTMINGLNTTGYKQFDVIFNTLPTQVYPRDMTFYAFAKSNAIVRFLPGKIQVLGS